MNRSFLSTAVAACVLSVQGCATILNDSTQPVAFSSDPQGAIVAVNGVAMGRTPCTLPIQRKGWDKQISFTLDGHKPVNFTLKNTLDGAVAGNFILGGIIGGVIDGISGRGGGYQESVQVVLVPVESGEDSRILPSDAAAKAAESGDGTGRIQSGEAAAVSPEPSRR